MTRKYRAEIVTIVLLLLLLIYTVALGVFDKDDSKDAEETKTITKSTEVNHEVKRLPEYKPKKELTAHNDGRNNDTSDSTDGTGNRINNDVKDDSLAVAEDIGTQPTVPQEVSIESGYNGDTEGADRSVEAATRNVERGAERATGRTIYATATYYTANCAGCTGITAAGYDVSNTTHANGYRVIATDPSVIPLGTIVQVDTPYESFTAIAGDTGGAINGSTIDILVGSESEAISKGRHDVTLTVINE
ncbi:hypothetical protein LAU42_09000 [Macrococcus armenti]|uniref:3D domain-containing protein n=1 Tax=Macrococcus armenti TaxID=2875764 RepID=UPI001CCE7357|nr:3D domain-containing protein [Macrococcus armenti]UBH21904.1 hypothetical protein LAU42_09000 [Macrococcus armenti]